jgi:hypothetical protein
MAGRRTEHLLASTDVLMRRTIRLTAVVVLITGWLIVYPATAFARDCYIDAATGKPSCIKTIPGSGPVPPANTNATTTSVAQNSGDDASATRTAAQAVGDNAGLAPGECAWKTLVPQPPAGDPRWEGNDPAAGVVQFNDCNGPTFYQFAAAAPAAPPPPDPAVLAQQAMSQLTLPKPSVERSPSAESSDPAQGGLPYTVVNLWTWFWTDPAVWADLSTTVSLQGVSATATAVPVALVFDPGDGGPAVSCPGPGRPWEVADGNDPPSRGGCGYRYVAVTPDGPLTSTVSIRWAVSWTGTGGVGGDLGEVTTSVTSSFLVQQIQVVSR